MAEVMSSLEPGNEEFSGGGAQDKQGANSVKMYPGSNERFPKLLKRLPSIVVDPMDSSEVESGELRWPPVETQALQHTTPASTQNPPGEDPTGDQQETD